MCWLVALVCVCVVQNLSQCAVIANILLMRSCTKLLALVKKDIKNLMPLPVCCSAQCFL